MKWGIICKPSEESFIIGKKIYEKLGEAILEYKIAEYMGKKGYSMEEIGKMVDSIIIVGGDGTILMTLQHVSKPIFSINTGRIGFLTEVEADEYEKAIEEILKGEYYIEERMKLKIFLNRCRLPDAANEIAIHSASLGKILFLKVFINEQIVQDICGDGIIVATPTGSTSYALSVGGPIVEPTLNVFIIAPIAPFRHIASPVIVSADKKINIKVEKNAKISIDGLHIEDFKPDDELIISASENKAYFMKLKDNFYKKIYEKIGYR